MTSRRVGDRYALEHEIGRGAGGAVWLARDEVLLRPVALKRLGLPTGGMGGEERSIREAKLAARVHHPHVVAVFDLVEDDDALWLVMEHVDGPSLSALIHDRGPLDPDAVAQLLAPIAEALVAAHDHGVIHRDVKPSNILIDEEGNAKLSDFGIARGEADATLTRTGMVTGSPAYLAPEVATGGQASAASDVWALGATLVHVLTGRPPYHRDDAENGPLAVLFRIVNEDPPRPESAGWLAPLIAMTMAADPSARPTMGAVRDYLRRPTGPAVATATATATLPMIPAIPAPAGSAPDPTPSPVVDLPAPPPPATPSPGSAPAPHRRPALVAGAVTLGVVALVIAILVLTRDEGGDRTNDAAPQAKSSSQAADGATTAVRTAAELEDFARTYVATATADPDAGFRMLTPTYQDQSPEYAAFWGSLRSPKISEVAGDPEAMTVTYTYSYSLQGEGRRTEQVTLDLEEHDGSLLIAGASARPL